MKNQEMKLNPMLNLLKKSLLDLPAPSSISMLWNMGFMLGFTLMLQIISGLILSMLFTADSSKAFETMVSIMRDNQMSWMTRMIHMNGASLFFILLYLHTSRGIYFSSPKNQQKTWISGVIILLVTMATAFLGYVLPWGQMSFWGAAVITGTLSAIPILGIDIVTWLWGGPSVENPTLMRFFSLHFILPIGIAGLVIIHIMMLHSKGSSNPMNIKSSMDKIKFNPMYSVKDSVPIMVTMLLFMLLISKNPNLLGDVENYSTANPLVAPNHIQPEWYFLFAYAILRAIPSKLGGVMALAASIMMLAYLIKTKNISTKFNPKTKLKFWFFISTVLILTWIGAKTVEPPFESIGQIYTTIYFLLILMS